MDPAEAGREIHGLVCRNGRPVRPLSVASRVDFGDPQLHGQVDVRGGFVDVPGASVRRGDAKRYVARARLSRGSSARRDGAPWSARWSVGPLLLSHAPGSAAGTTKPCTELKNSPVTLKITHPLSGPHLPGAFPKATCLIRGYQEL